MFLLVPVAALPPETFPGKGDAEHLPIYPRNSKPHPPPLPLQGVWGGGGNGRAGTSQDPALRGECFACQAGTSVCQPLPGKLKAIPLANRPPRSIARSPLPQPFSLAESLETILPTCTSELPELFKDTRIFLLRSCVTWLANAGQLAAAAASITLAASGGWGTTGWHPRNRLLALQWGPVMGPSCSGSSASRKARCCAAAAPLSSAGTTFWRLLRGDGTRRGLCYR